MSLAPVRVKGVLAKCLAMVATLANKQGVALVDNIELDDTVAVYADTIRLRQVVINFLSNAIKYKRAQGSVVTLSGVRRDGIVRISVADNGPGISEANQARVFNAFDRLGREAGSEEGAGIGLVISKRIVDAMGGRIGFDSVVGVGSTFWLELSVVDGVAESAPDAPEAGTLADAGAPHAARHRVLYIEDNPMNQRLMKRIFEARKNLELHAADSAELGIEMARTEQPILILMDINLPGIDGYEALKLLRSDPRTANIPVIALSANAMKGDRERGFNAGFADYIVKPIDVKKMHGIVDRVIAGRDATRFDLR
jgi:CheY-like chemotaxis protein